MKKIGIFLCAVVLTFFVIGRGYAQVSLDLGSTFNSFADSRIKGQGSSFGFLFDLGADMTAGYVTESANISLASDLLAPIYPGTVDVSEIRVLRNLGSIAGLNTAVGLGVGTTRISAAAAAPFVGVNTNTSVLEILTNIAYLSKEGAKVTGKISLTIGYRIIDIADVLVPFGAGSKTLSDLNSIILGLGVALKF